MARATATWRPGSAEKQLRELNKLRVVVGVLGAKATEQHKDGGGTVVNVATIHEYGAPEVGIPERSFLRSTLKTQKDVIFAFTKRRVNAIAAGESTATEAYNKIGVLLAESLIPATMRAGIDPPLKRPRPRTKTQRKKDDRLKKKGLPVPKKVEIPLIDGGQLIGSIAYEVRRK